MFCINCGKQLEEGTKFCPGCGTPVNSGAQNTADQDVIVQIPARRPAAPAPKKTNKKLIAIVSILLVLALAVGGTVGWMISWKISGSDGSDGENAGASDTSENGTSPQSKENWILTSMTSDNADGGKDTQDLEWSENSVLMRGENGEARYEFDNSGNITKMTVYDKDGNKTEETVFSYSSKNGKTDRIDVSLRNSTYSIDSTCSFLYTYQNDNISSIDVKKDNESCLTYDYTYDNNNRVSAIKCDSKLGGKNNSSSCTVDWVQDSAVVKEDGEEYFTLNYIDGKIKSIFQDQEELLVLSYDINGNIVKEEFPDRNHSYSWKTGGTRAQAAVSQAITDLYGELYESIWLNPRPCYSALYVNTFQFSSYES